MYAVIGPRDATTPYIDDTLTIDATSLAKSKRGADPAQVHDGQQVELDDGSQLLVRLLLQRPVVVGGRVVHQDVEPAVLTFDVHDELLAEQRVGEIAGQRIGAAEIRRQRLQPIGPAGGDHDVGARGGEHAREPVSQPGGRAGHERDPSVEAKEVLDLWGVGHAAQFRVLRGRAP